MKLRSSGPCYGRATPFVHKARWTGVKYVGCISIESLPPQNCINVQPLLTIGKAWR